MGDWGSLKIKIKTLKKNLLCHFFSWLLVSHMRGGGG